MDSKKKKSKWPLVVAVALLATLCIGGVELAVCRVADPALYERLTGPFRAWLSDTGAALAAIPQRLAPTPEPTPEPSFEDQLAGEPTLANPLPVVDPTVTRLDPRPDGNWLTGGSADILYYRQSAPEWADQPYGRDNIGSYGCGPTAMAMAVSSLTDRTIDPVEFSSWAYDSGYWVSRSGSRLSLIEGSGEAFGLNVQSLAEPTPERLLQELSSGKLAVALMTSGHFTKGGHFILLRGATLDGQILVADPNSEERSLTTWDPQLILDELSPSRHSGAPLWLLSATAVS